MRTSVIISAAEGVTAAVAIGGQNHPPFRSS
jgi:hypothetical protein